MPSLKTIDEMTPKWIDLQLTERFSNVLFPIDIPLLLRQLPNIGYIVPRKVLRGVLEPGEAIATKGDSELIISQDNKILGVHCPDLKQLIASFTELRKYWIEVIKPNPMPETHYLEIQGNGIIFGSKNPLVAFEQFWGKSKLMDGLSSVVGFQVSNYGITLVKQGTSPNVPDWFDLRIDPSVISSDNKYHFRIVWRDHSVDSMVQKASTTDELIVSLIKKIQAA